MIYMIRIFLVLFFVSSCSFISYSDTLPLLRTAILGVPEIDIDQKFYDDREYSFAYMRVGRQASVILSLKSISKEGIYEWVSAGDERVFTYNGKIIKTHGVVYDMEYLNSEKELFKQDSTLLIKLENPHAITEQNIEFSKKENSILKRFDKEINVQIDEELVLTKGFRWKYKNEYFVDIKNGYVIKATQRIHPELPVLEIDYYYKFSN